MNKHSLIRGLTVFGIILAGVGFLALSVPSQTVNMGRTYVASQNVRYANEAGTGTTVNKLAKLTGAPSTAIITATTDTSGIVGIVVAGAGTTGSADIAFKGKALCVFDSATTAGHYVLNDTSTAGDCMDSGAATYPTTGQVIGIVTSTNGGAGTYEVDLTLGQAQAGGSGGASSSYGAVASLPATCAVGDLYRTSDSLYEYQCTALNTWTAFYDGRRVTPPPSTGWSWDNQGPSTISSASGYEFLHGVAASANQLRVRYRAAPATPYTVTALMLHDTTSGGNSLGVNVGVGLIFRESGTGKLLLCSLGPAIVATTKYTNSTTFSADYKSVAGNRDIHFKNPSFLRIEDTGVNLIFYLSLDGYSWVQFDSRARTNFMAGGPDEIGFGAWANNADGDIALLDWSVN